MIEIKLIPVMEQKHEACQHCICSVCLIAETNGGAPGCGNCRGCKGENPCNNCKEFLSTVRLVPFDKADR